MDPKRPTIGSMNYRVTSRKEGEDERTEHGGENLPLESDLPEHPASVTVGGQYSRKGDYARWGFEVFASTTIPCAPDDASIARAQTRARQKTLDVMRDVVEALTDTFDMS